MIVLGVIKIETPEIDGKVVSVITEKNFENKNIKDYHKPFISVIRKHYDEYKSITNENALTPNKFIGSVRHRFDFNDNNYKFGEIYRRLEHKGLVKRRFPFYYLHWSLTKKGAQARLELRGLIDQLSEAISKTKEKEELNGLKEKLGLNIILISGAFKRIEQATTKEPAYVGSGLNFDPYILWDLADLGLSDFEVPDFEMPDWD
ncbi:hypothetical protein WSM22_36030 [Cytophagales bacterium WSM2-2]|nr:hypothetical protein WSM22_36030 [Cytophagales bacterium WSM2-2]